MLHLVRKPSRELLGECFGALAFDPKSATAYGDNTRLDVSWLVDKAMSAAWITMVVTQDRHPLDIYWMHDFYDGCTWVGGYKLSAERVASHATEEERHDHRELHRASWRLMRREIESLGYPHIFFATLLHNQPSHLWVIEGFEATQVAVHPSFLHHRGNIVPARIYAQRPDDAGMAITKANERAARPVPGWAG